MNISEAFAYLSKEWHVFFAWIETLIAHHQAGTLPPAPVAVNVNPVTTNAPPVPPVVPAPGHGATPPPNAGTVGSQVGQSVPGGDKPDANGAIAIPAIATKFPANVRFLTLAALPFVPPGSAQSFTIAANCGNVRWLEGAFVNIPDFGNYKPLPAVANPSQGALVGGAAFHLHGQAPGEQVFSPIPNCVALSSILTTMDEIVSYCAKLPVYGSVHTISPVA